VLAGWAREDAALTHAHPFCRDASPLFAVTIAHAVRTGQGPRDVFNFAKAWASRPGVHAEVRWALAEAEQRPPQDFFSQMGWVHIALHNAFYRLLHAPDLESGVVDTVMCGGDTDTTAAITGALLGAVYGEAAVPRQWRDAVLTCRPQAGLPGVRRPRPRDFWPTDVLSLADRLVVLGAAQPGAPASRTCSAG
jgi:ADP-ribosylglycohydrolase